MNKDNYMKFQENLDDCLRIKINLLLFTNYIGQYCITVDEYKLYDHTFIREIISSTCDIYFLLIQRLKGNEICLKDLLKNDQDLNAFLVSQGLNDTIFQTSFSYSLNLNEISDINVKNLKKIEILEMLKDDSDKIQEEISLIHDFRKQLLQKINNLSLCFYCKQEGKSIYGEFMCKTCRQTVCKDHYFDNDKCNSCFKKDYLRSKKKA
jgi:hypothetical protein